MIMCEWERHVLYSYIILYYTSFYIAFIFLILTPEGPHPLSNLCNNNCATNTFFFLRSRAVQSRLASVIFCLPSDSFIAEGQQSAAVLEHR